jgi:transcriptional regulator with XRE-family HTH domain
VIANNILDISDVELIATIGDRLRDYRLQQNLVVEEVASEAGLHPNTVLNAEAGRNPRLETVIRLLRVYGRLDAIDAFLPPPEVSPIQLVRTAGRGRKRASRKRDG